MSNSVATREEVLPPEAQAPQQVPAAVSESAAIFQIIERAAANPGVDIDKLERLLLMQERIAARNAKAAYSAALSRMQPDLPVITEHGKIEIRDKLDKEKVLQSTRYAKFEDISEAIRPAMAAHGFALSFRCGVTPEGKIAVTGVLSHAEGHSEETTMVLPHDATGSKNAVQAVGSSTSYGRRYVTIALLNLTSRAPEERDDDGHAAGAPATISDEQIETLTRLIEETGSDIARFCKRLKVESLALLPAEDFESAVRLLREKAARKAKEPTQ